MRHLVHPVRTPVADARLGFLLAFVAGAVNAGGFLAVGRYTSHMTGLLSTVADEVALGGWAIVGVAGLGIGSFLLGAVTSSVLVHYSRYTRPHRQWALPLFLEGLLIAAFGLYGTCLPEHVQVPAMGIMLLCGIMGLQNATVSKISGARIRTTHVTGMFTDLGIELGRWLVPKVLPLVHPEPSVLPKTEADMPKARLLATLIMCFVTGGVVGAFGFTLSGLGFAFPLAACLLALTTPTVLGWKEPSNL